MATAQTSPPSSPAYSGNRAPARPLRDTSRQGFPPALAPASRRADRLPYSPSAARSESPPCSRRRRSPQGPDTRSSLPSPLSRHRRATIDLVLFPLLEYLRRDSFITRNHQIQATRRSPSRSRQLTHPFAPVGCRQFHRRHFMPLYRLRQ